MDDDWVTRLHAVGHVAWLPGQLHSIVAVENRNKRAHRIERFEWRVFLILIGLHAEAEHTIGVIHAQHSRLHNSDGIRVQLAIFNQARPHQLQMQQVLGKGTVGTSIFR